MDNTWKRVPHILRRLHDAPRGRARYEAPATALLWAICAYLPAAAAHLGLRAATGGWFCGLNGHPDLTGFGSDGRPADGLEIKHAGAFNQALAGHQLLCMTSKGLGSVLLVAPAVELPRCHAEVQRLGLENRVRVIGYDKVAEAVEHALEGSATPHVDLFEAILDVEDIDAAGDAAA